MKEGYEECSPEQAELWWSPVYGESRHGYGKINVINDMGFCFIEMNLADIGFVPCRPKEKEVIEFEFEFDLKADDIMDAVDGIFSRKFPAWVAWKKGYHIEVKATEL